MPSPYCVVLALALALPAAAAVEDDGDGVTPYRPSVSSPAQLPLPGQLEVELGLLRSRSDGARRDSLPTTLKLGFTPEWGVVLSGEALVSAPDGSGRTRGAGDAVLLLKRAVLLDQDSAVGLELGAKVPSARTGIGSGKADYTLNTILSRELGAVHLDLNLNLTQLGAVDAGGRRQTGASAALSLPLAARWGLTLEWSGSRRAGADAMAQCLLAATYSPTPRLTFDAGLARGLTPGTPDWSFFTGMVFPLARLW